MSLRFSSGVAGCAASDCWLSIANKTSWHPLGRRIGALGISIYKPYSRGRLTLGSADPAAAPRIEFNLLTDRRDMARMADGLTLAHGISGEPELKAVINDVFPSSYSERVRSVGIVNRKNLLLTTFLAHLLDGPQPVRRYLIKKVLTEGDELRRLLADEDALEAYVRRTATGTWHASCTVRMGRADDPTAACDNQGHVKGVACLRVVDASLMPSTPRANTNIPTIMTAEKIADAMAAG